MIALCGDNPTVKRPTIETLVTEDLGYCCEWFFFSRFRRSSVVAARLGVTSRAVRYHLEAVKLGNCACENKPNCMKRVLDIR